MYQLTHTSIHIIHVGILQTFQSKLRQVSIRLQSIESSNKVVENNADNLHQCHVRTIEYGAVPNADLYVAALQPCTLKQKTILHLRMNVDQT